MAYNMSSLHYKNVIREFNNIASCSREQMSILHNQFECELNSKRILGNISSISSLIKILERRDVINKDNLDALKLIATLMKREDLLILLNTNQYPNIQCANIVNNAPNNAIPQNRHSIGIKKAYKMISEEIGKKWIDLARQLGNVEGQIDELEKSGLCISERVIKCLKKHETDSDPNYWRSRLLLALEAVRRKDLRNQIQEIFDFHDIIRPEITM